MLPDLHYGSYLSRKEILARIRSLKSRRESWNGVIDIGPSQRPWSAEVLDAAIDIFPCPAARVNFSGDLNDPRSWMPLLDYCQRHGKFSFCICSHVLEDLSYPQIALEFMPQVAERGFIAMPSIWSELKHNSGNPFKGAIHHRWIAGGGEKGLALASKITLLEYLSFNIPEPITWDDEIRLFWEGTIASEFLNNNYLGPTPSDVIEMYKKFVYQCHMHRKSFGDKPVAELAYE